MNVYGRNIVLFSWTRVASCFLSVYESSRTTATGEIAVIVFFTEDSGELSGCMLCANMLVDKHIFSHCGC